MSRKCGFKHTEETLIKLRAKRHSPETKVKMSATHIGMKHTTKTKIKMSAAAKIRNTPEYLAKLSIAAMGKQCSAETKAKISIAKIGTKHSAETRAKMSIGHIGKKHSTESKAKRSGPLNPRWMGGISRLPYAWDFTNELKEEVRRRDGYKCQICGVPQKECTKALLIHHIDYCKTNSDPVNLIALCLSCHTRTNTNRKYWEDLFQQRILSRDT